MKKFLIGLAVASMAVAGLGGSASAAPSSVYDSISGLGSYEARLMKAAGLDAGTPNLDSCADGAGQYTVFFPVQAALVALVQKLGKTTAEPGETAFELAFDAILADKATVRGLLALHVVSGTLTGELLITDGYTNLPTVGGVNITKTTEDNNVDEDDETTDPDTILVNDIAVVGTLPLSCNGVVHLIAGVITPPSAPAAPSCGANYVGQCPAAAPAAGTGSGLPATGSESMALTYAALASLIAGAGVLVIRRRSVA